MAPYAPRSAQARRNPFHKSAHVALTVPEFCSKRQNHDQRTPVDASHLAHDDRRPSVRVTRLALVSDPAMRSSAPSAFFGFGIAHRKIQSELKLCRDDCLRPYPPGRSEHPNAEQHRSIWHCKKHSKATRDAPKQPPEIPRTIESLELVSPTPNSAGRKNQPVPLLQG